MVSDRGVAQLVEYRSPKPVVVGSSPTAPANDFNDLSALPKKWLLTIEGYPGFSRRSEARWAPEVSAAFLGKAAGRGGKKDHHRSCRCEQSPNWIDRAQPRAEQDIADQRGAICSSSSAILCSADGSLSPSLAERRMVSAIACTCAVLTGSGSDATAASKAIFITVIVSGGNDAFEKSFIGYQTSTTRTSMLGERFRSMARLSGQKRERRSVS